MFEDTVLRLSDKERQQRLAEEERALVERQANLAARQQNLAHRQLMLKTNPNDVSNAIDRDDRQRAEEKQHASDAARIKGQFGLKAHELIDTPAMRGALEQALAEKDVEQQMRAEKIADRASLLSGLNKLAMMDASKAAEILNANKDLNPPRVWSRQEVAEMFARAQSHVDDKGNTRNFGKSLDGWADSIAFRKRELELAEIKLDAQEQALRAQVRRAIDGPEKGAAQPVAEQSTSKVAERTVEAAVGVATVAANAKGPVTIDTSLETLKDPAKFAATVDQVVKTSGVSAEQAKATLDMLREVKESGTARAPAAEVSEKAAIEAAREAFYARGASLRRDRSNVVDIGNGKRAAETSPVERVERGVAAAAGAQVNGAEAGGEARAAVKGIEGFRPLGRNKTKDLADRGPAQVAPTEAGQAVDGSNAKGVQRPTAEVARPIEVNKEREPKSLERERKSFKDLNAHERIERRAEFFGDLRQNAGYSRDGKEAVSERAREAARSGKQRDGYGVG
ncbi:hypothetical protein [Paraburkholderia ginsengisoli]|uniref:Uncharacterized protein n=1 Tax=Paraburkholderia ginsengisoli TaxID=311231 RepID=A0A7T4TCR3_9BURK|nr:hypothetical protein [Paraburkholderia ginsengisoli]QQC67848.1 hypothetical protein I6I06_28940 [Paraburkholderia ginsengisoli]